MSAPGKDGCFRGSTTRKKRHARPESDCCRVAVCFINGTNERFPLRPLMNCSLLLIVNLHTDSIDQHCFLKRWWYSLTWFGTKQSKLNLVFCLIYIRLTHSSTDKASQLTTHLSCQITIVGTWELIQLHVLHVRAPVIFYRRPILRL